MVICRIYAVFSGEFGMISTIISSHMHSDGDSNLGNQQKEWDLELIFSCQDLQQTVQEQKGGTPVNISDLRWHEAVLHQKFQPEVVPQHMWSYEGSPKKFINLALQHTAAMSWSPSWAHCHSSVHPHPQAEEAHALQETSGGRGAQLDVSPKWFQRLQSKMSRMVRNENE
jgi:hypothetical protein